ncbi:MAG TPA: hypothetical protein HPP77_07805 [Candidatus Hydrogenedentes bacterium]|nr:hypothetical protein [Candidatus Hydrogenedentota bacterium]
MGDFGDGVTMNLPEPLDYLGLVPPCMGGTAARDCFDSPSLYILLNGNPLSATTVYENVTGTIAVEETLFTVEFVVKVYTVWSQ